MTEPVTATMRDLRAIKGCAKGARYFCKTHGLDYEEFRLRGLDGRVLEATGDAMAIRLVEAAREREEAERGGR